jgi:prepilin-type N-terminal cleavage/methylation domain-containing protein
MRKHARTKRGFTLTEILVALAIFALGGTAIMTLFITNMRLSRQAMDYTRASEITRNVRSLMSMSLSRPIMVNQTDAVYQFYYPESSLTFVPREYLDSYEGGDYAPSTDAPIGGSVSSNMISFRLPRTGFNASVTGEGNLKNMVTRLPNDAATMTGAPMSFKDGRKPEVFRLLPDTLRRSGAIDGLDADDRMFYSFDLSIRRSVQRSGINDEQGNRIPLDDLHVVHVKVYKGFDFTPDTINDPLFEWSFYVNASR